MREGRLKIDVADGVADVRLSRGDKHNGLDAEMYEALVGGAAQVGSSRGVRAVVLSGDGPSFCAGLDFKAIMGGTGLVPERAFSRGDGDVANFAQRATYDWQRLEVPVIAAIHGACFGGGLQLALAADLRFAAPDAKLSIMEVNYGLVPDMGLSQSLPDLVGIDVAKELTFTGRTVGAEEALRIGLVTRLADDPRAEAFAVAREIAAKSPDAVRAAKRLLDRSWRASPDVGLGLEAESQQRLIGSPNQLAALQAALSGEPAEFSEPD